MLPSPKLDGPLNRSFARGCFCTNQIGVPSHFVLDVQAGMRCRIVPMCCPKTVQPNLVRKQARHCVCVQKLGQVDGNFIKLPLLGVQGQ